MSDVNIRNLLSNGRAQLAANIEKHKVQVGYLKDSLILAKKMGEDTTNAEAMLKTLEGLLDVMEKQLKTEMK